MIRTTNHRPFVYGNPKSACLLFCMTEIHFKFKAGSISTEAQTFLCESIKRVGTRATKRHAIS